MSPTINPLKVGLAKDCLFIDLELTGKTAAHLEAWASLANNYRRVELEIKKGERLTSLELLASEVPPNTRFLVGHNIINHDRQFIESILPQAPILDLPVIDTLYLAPLAYPQRPYHKLIKEYKQTLAEKSNPEEDCYLANKLLLDCIQQLTNMERQYLGLLDVYRSCLIDSSLAGNGQLIETLGGRRISNAEIIQHFIKLAADKICQNRAKQEIERLLSQPQSRPALAYALAWLLVADSSSIIPHWVRHKHPQSQKLLHALRMINCQENTCQYCLTEHSLIGNLNSLFGFSDFQPEPMSTDGTSLQKEITAARFANQPLLGIMPTGGGKSLCFQLPAIMHHRQSGGLTIVISPLQALMKDQVDNLHRKTKSPDTLAATLNGLQTVLERNDVIERLQLGEYALLYVSPEQLRSRRFKRTIRQRQITAWVFDEAHCLTQWGHDFRPDYHYAGRFIREFSEEENQVIAPVACFTATAKLDVQKEICQYFKDTLNQELLILAADQVNRNNLNYTVEEVLEPHKLSRVDQLLQEHLVSPQNEFTGSAIIYARSRARTERFAENLKQRDWSVRHFHAGLEIPEKKEVQDEFITGKIPIIVATNAFGMGVDKDDVRLVIHVDIPSSVENYLQESGRAGRDKKTAQCVLLFSEVDIDRQFDLLSRGQLTHRDLAQILRAIRKLSQRLNKNKQLETKKEIVVSVGDLLRVPGTRLSFETMNRDTSIQVGTAVSWLERAKFVLRNENRPRIFMGGSVVLSPTKIDQKIESAGLSKAKAQRWQQTIELLRRADARQGVDLDVLATLPAFRGLFKWLAEDKKYQDDPEEINKEVNRIIIETLYQMADAQIIKTGIHFSAWLRHKHPNSERNSKVCLDGLSKLQEYLVNDLLPKRYNGLQDFKISLNELQPLVRKEGFNFLNDDLQRFISSWHNNGCRLKVIKRGQWRLKLAKDWHSFQQHLKHRIEVCQHVLGYLGEKADRQGLRGEQLILFTLDDLSESFKSDIFTSQLPNPSKAATEALLFLDRQNVVNLDRGLSLFRQAMTLTFEDDAQKGAYTQKHYQPLNKHYKNRIFQIHVIGHYAKLAQENRSTGQKFVENYFHQSQDDFQQTHMADVQILDQPLATSQYQRIIKGLSKQQKQVVTASKNKNLLVLAGPGSGKTKVLVHRCAYLLQVERIHPKSLLVVCYNRYAMYELRHRIRQLVGSLALGVEIHTYHSLALRICERSLLDEYELREEGLSNEDFTDMISQALRRLRGADSVEGREADELRDQLLAGYEYILVDEYQDINQLQYNLLAQIAKQVEDDDENSSRKATILVVGDDDQTIYDFQGARAEFIEQFQSDFGGQTHYLTENYRSTASIINASNHLISYNPERLKADFPITINTERNSQPVEGTWKQENAYPFSAVSLTHVDNALSSNMTVERYLKRLKNYDKKLSWNQFAILARTNSEANQLRAHFLENGVPVCWPIPKQTSKKDSGLSSLPLLRIREFRQLFAYLNQDLNADCNIKKLQTKPPNICGAQSLWHDLGRHLLNVIADNLKTEVCLSGDLLTELKKQLLVTRNEYTFGQGVFVGTVHSAKGLEFDHVVILGGGWKKSIGKFQKHLLVNERRLYYVAMTRAKQTLLIVNRRDELLPFAAELKQATIGEYESINAPSNQQMVTYAYLGMKDIVLSYPGWQTQKNPIHQALRQARTLDPVKLKPDSQKPDKIGVYDGRNRLIARLSKSACQEYNQYDWGNSIIEARIFALIRRTKNDRPRSEAFQDAQDFKPTKVDSWEIPLIQIRYIQTKDSAPNNAQS